MEKNDRSFNRRKGRLDSDIHTNYFCIKDQIKKNDKYLEYCNGAISKCDFYIFINNLLNEFIEKNVRTTINIRGI